MARRFHSFQKELGRIVTGKIGKKNGGTSFFIGSGVIEVRCKIVIGARCKQSDMFWGEPGAENVLALRCIHSSRRLTEFWKDRLNAHAPRNDA